MPAQKKVLFTSHTANFAKFNRPFMRMLKQQGYEVHYASAGEEKVLDCDKHFTVPFKRSPFKIANYHAYKQLKKIIETNKYDLIHTHTPMGSVVTRLAARGARAKGTKVIYTAHGLHFFKGAPLVNWLIYFPIEWVMARYTDILVTINREDFKRAKVFAEAARYMPGVGVDLERFRPVDAAQKNELRKKYGYAKDDFILIYIAELNSNKNQTFLINHFYPLLLEIPNIKLLLCGVGDGEWECKQLVSELSMQDRIEFLGYRNDVDSLLALSDVAVSASRREGLGINLIEAMAVGLPLIAFNNRGHRDIITHDKNGYLYRGGREFIDCVIALNGDTRLARRMSQKNISDAKKYSVQVAEANMQRIYKEVI